MSWLLAYLTSFSTPSKQDWIKVDVYCPERVSEVFVFLKNYLGQLIELVLD